jgi:hypothetical protein
MIGYNKHMININEFILNAIEAKYMWLGSPVGTDVKGDTWESPAYWFQYRESEFCQVIWSAKKKKDGDL